MGKIEEPQMSEEELRNLLEYSECATFVLEQGMEFKLYMPIRNFIRSCVIRKKSLPINLRIN